MKLLGMRCQGVDRAGPWSERTGRRFYQSLDAGFRRRALDSTGARTCGGAFRLPAPSRGPTDDANSAIRLGVHECRYGPQRNPPVSSSLQGMRIEAVAA